MKVNMDDVGRGAIRAICKYHTTTYLGSSVVFSNGPSDFAMLETIACMEALSILGDLELKNIYVVPDYKNVVDDIKEGSLGRYGAIIKEIKE